MKGNRSDVEQCQICSMHQSCNSSKDCPLIAEQPKLQKYARSRTDNAEDAEDIVAVTLMKLYRAKIKSKYTVIPWKRLVWKILKQEIANHYRNWGRLQKYIPLYVEDLTEALGESDETDPEIVAISNEQSEELAREIKFILKIEDQVILALRREGWDWLEISEILEEQFGKPLSKKTIQNRYSEAVKKLFIVMSEKIAK